jgi:hypothetical protein
MSNEKMKQFYDISKNNNNNQLQDAIYFLSIHKTRYICIFNFYKTKGNGVL